MTGSLPVTPLFVAEFFVTPKATNSTCRSKFSGFDCAHIPRQDGPGCPHAPRPPERGQSLPELPHAPDQRGAPGRRTDTRDPLADETRVDRGQSSQRLQPVPSRSIDRLVTGPANRMVWLIVLGDAVATQLPAPRRTRGHGLVGQLARVGPPGGTRRIGPQRFHLGPGPHARCPRRSLPG